MEKKFKMKNCKRFLACLLCALMLMSVLPVATIEANAATFEDINNSSVFVKQNTNYTCTLASAVMLVRRTAMAAGNNNWASITESSMRGTAWLEGSGLYYNFTYAGVSVGHANAGSSRKNFYINLLKQYPQGVVAYNSGNGNQWHAILLTDYNSSTDTFYCADPANGTASGRIALASSSIVGSGQNGKINNLNEYWYVKSPSVSLSSSKITTTITFDPNGGDILNGSTKSVSYQLVYGTRDYYEVSWLTPKRVGYTFLGWYTSKTGGKQIYNAAGHCINDGEYWNGTGSICLHDYTVYAQWVAKKTVLTLNPVGGTFFDGSSGSYKCTLTYNTADYYLVSWLAPKKVGYNFVGWYNSETGGKMIYNEKGHCINDGEYWKDNFSKSIGDYTVYARWEKNPVTPDKPNESAPESKPCDCNCHKTGFTLFIWKIMNFFHKIFGMSQYKTCDCGNSHW